jgi:hypothetical protein
MLSSISHLLDDIPSPYTSGDGCRLFLLFSFCVALCTFSLVHRNADISYRMVT